MNIAALIPARSGSKRIPDKNIRELGGRPLLAWSITTAHECNLEAYVSSDSTRYLDTAKSWGGIPIGRPDHLASDETGDMEVIAHAWPLMGKPDLVVYLRPTTPFREAYIVEGAIDYMVDAHQVVDSLRSVERLSESAYKAFVLRPGGVLRPIVRSMTIEDAGKADHLLPETVKGNGVVDIVQPKWFMFSRLWGDSVCGWKTKPVIELDTEEQWRYAEWWVEHHKV